MKMTKGIVERSLTDFYIVLNVIVYCYRDV